MIDLICAPAFWASITKQGRASEAEKLDCFDHVHKKQLKACIHTLTSYLDLKSTLK